MPYAIPPTHTSAGWLLKSEDQLTSKERAWRDLFDASYTHSNGLNDLDFAHAELNYRGLVAWQALARKYLFIRRHMITTDGVEVYFRSKADFESDVYMENEFCWR